jgi:hypothetical protein
MAMGLLKTAAKAAVVSSVHGRVQRRQQQRWAAQDAAAGTAFPPAHPDNTFVNVPPTGGTAVPPVQPDMQQQLALLSQLAELKNAGALTEAEFEAKKAQILQL